MKFIFSALLQQGIYSMLSALCAIARLSVRLSHSVS